MARSNGFRLGRLLGSNITIQADKIAADAVGGGSSVTAYATAAALPLSGNTTGDQAFVSETGRLYIFTGTGWYNIALVTSDISGTTGADVIGNIVSLTQADYDAISTPDSTTLYVITG